MINDRAVQRSWTPHSVRSSGARTSVQVRYPPINACQGMDNIDMNRHCHGFKPPRTHHCQTCSSCVLKMDHHCIWIDNCVGFNNQGHFTRFLLHTSPSVWLALYLTLRQVVSSVLVDAALGQTQSPGRLAIVAMNIVILTPLSIILPMMAWNQVVFSFRSQSQSRSFERRCHFLYKT